jgi:hypothetical protein
MPLTDPRPWLDKLEELVDPKHVAESQKLQEDCWDGKRVSHIPLLLSSQDDMSKERSHFADWPLCRLEETQKDMGKMLLGELMPACEGALIRDDKMYTIRANYGVGIIPSMLGCKVHQEGDEYPWVDPIEDAAQIRSVVKKGVPSLTQGLFPRVVETQDYYRKMLAPYPNLSKTVHIALCDVQGPFNLAFELLGTRIFTDIVDDPQLVRDALKLTTETFIAVAKKEKELIGEPLDSGWHYQYRLKGGVRVCEDNALSISPRMYMEFCREVNERVYATFGGGYFLVCGSFAHVQNELLDTRGLRGLCYWSDRKDEFLPVWRACRQRGVCLLWYGLPEKKDLRQIDTGAIIKVKVGSVDEGRRIMSECGA